MAWEQLLSIYREAVDEARDEKSRPPQACPLCGEPLRIGPQGQLFCPFDGWQPGLAGSPMEG